MQMVVMQVCRLGLSDRLIYIFSWVAYTQEMPRMCNCEMIIIIIRITVQESMQIIMHRCYACSYLT